MSAEYVSSILLKAAKRRGQLVSSVILLSVVRSITSIVSINPGPDQIKDVQAALGFPCHNETISI